MNDTTTDYDAKHANSKGTTLGEFQAGKETKYKGYVIDDNLVIWGPQNGFMGKANNVTHAKHIIDAWVDG
jgi:hypothetical protein